MILADSSAWVEFDRATNSPVDRALTELIARDGPIAITEPIVMEVCAGARSPAREVELRRMLDRFTLARFDAASDFTGAVTIYRSCRARAITPRGLLDCMIAAVSLRHGAILLAWDRDLVLVAEVMGIDLHPASGPHGV